MPYLSNMIVIVASMWSGNCCCKGGFWVVAAWETLTMLALNRPSFFVLSSQLVLFLYLSSVILWWTGCFFLFLASGFTEIYSCFLQVFRCKLDSNSSWSRNPKTPLLPCREHGYLFWIFCLSLDYFGNFGSCRGFRIHLCALFADSVVHHKKSWCIWGVDLGMCI